MRRQLELTPPSAVTVERTALGPPLGSSAMRSASELESHLLLAKDLKLRKVSVDNDAVEAVVYQEQAAEQLAKRLHRSSSVFCLTTK
jgi:hypothetical protein